MKHTAHNMFHLERMRESFPDKAYIGGFDEVVTAAVAAGAQGAIGTTIGLQVELFVAAREFLRRGDLKSAQRVQGRINETISALVEIDVFPAAKKLSGLPFDGLGNCRRPFLPLSEEQVERINRISESVELNIDLTRQELSRVAGTGAAIGDSLG